MLILGDRIFLENWFFESTGQKSGNAIFDCINDSNVRFTKKEYNVNLYRNYIGKYGKRTPKSISNIYSSC